MCWYDYPGWEGWCADLTFQRALAFLGWCSDICKFRLEPRFSPKATNRNYIMISFVVFDVDEAESTHSFRPSIPPIVLIDGVRAEYFHCACGVFQAWYAPFMVPTGFSAVVSGN